MTAKPAAQSASFFTGASRVFGMSIGEMLWSRRTIFMALVVGSPVLVALVARIVQSAGIAPLRVNGVQVDAVSMFGAMIWILFLSFIVPVLGVFYGTSLIADEVDDKTITYLFTRPVRRGAVIVGKYMAYLVCTTLVVLPSVMIVYFLMVPFGQIPASFVSLVVDLGVLGLGLAAYGALASTCHPAGRRAQPTTAPMFGTSATRQISSPESGWGLIVRKKSKRMRKAASSRRQRTPRS